MKRAAFLLLLPASPALAATGPFFSLGNSNFVALIAFVIFVGALIYFKAPVIVARMVDGRIDAIRNQIETASRIRADSAEALELAGNSSRESIAHAERTVESARQEAKLFVAEAEKTIGQTIERRLQAAGEHIASVEAAAVAGIRNEAISIAVEAAGQVIAETMSGDDRKSIMDRAIDDVRSNLN